MKRRTGLTIAVRLLIGMSGIGTRAWFTDIESFNRQANGRWHPEPVRKLR